MPKQIQTFLGTATVHSQRISGRSGKLSLSLSAFPGLQSVVARRLATASEPNTYIWSVGGLKNLPDEQIIAPNPQAAIRQYLTQVPKEISELPSSSQKGTGFTE